MLLSSDGILWVTHVDSGDKLEVKTKSGDTVYVAEFDYRAANRARPVKVKNEQPSQALTLFHDTVEHDLTRKE